MIDPAGDDARRKLRQEFEARRGYWTPWLEELLQRSPDFFKAFLQFTGTPWASGPLPPAVKELVYIVIDASITHLYEPGLRKHMADAMRQGATPDQVMEALQLASAIGLHSTTTGALLLRQALADAGGAAAAAPDADRAARRQAFEAATGHWDEGLEALLQLDPGAFDAHAGYLRAAWNTRTLDPVTRELLGVAVHASTTLLHKPGIALHMRRALAAGATEAQILEVLQLTSVLGIHTCSVGLPLLAAEVARSG